MKYLWPDSSGRASWRPRWKESLTACPHCKSRANPLRLVFMERPYQCPHCDRHSAFASTHRTVLFFVYLAVAVLFWTFSPATWTMWDLAEYLFLGLALAELAAVSLLMRLKPL